MGAPAIIRPDYAAPRDVIGRARRALQPPPRLRLSDWLERHLRIPEGVSALPGPVRLYPYQRGIADAIGDPLIERVTVVKPVRVGFTTLLTGAIASYVANDPAPILALLPTQDDCRDYVVSDVEPIFENSPAVAGKLSADVEEGKRNTILHRRFAGGSLKVVASKAPRNLRRHNVRILVIDEADAMEVGKEGSPILLAEKRTLQFVDRKIVLGSTPLDEDTSHVLRSYARSDQRVFEVPCPRCEVFTEIQWAHIEWDREGEAHRPDTAAFRCPGCEQRIPEREKPGMVARGRWRATAPEIQGHAGFRLNALVSGLANASWGKLAAEFLKAKDDSDELRVFVNTILAQGWRDAAVEVEAEEVQKRAEPFGLENLPADVLLLTAGTDVQDDRLESSLVGWTRTGPFVLGHVVLWGSPDEDTVWSEHDDLLRATWAHPLGGRLGVDACMIDSGDRADTVYAYAFPRFGRKVWAVKGIAGPRPVCEPSKSTVKAKGGLSGRLFLAGVDTVKATIYDRLARGRGIRFSRDLEPVYYEQLASERKVIRYNRGQPVRRFERKTGARAEALDCLVYAWAARHILVVDLDQRERHLSTPGGEPPPAAGRGVIRSKWAQRLRE